ncbi:MAG: UDPGP type 1 family protein [Planctomycetes bacterium]|nr:UDPGP type 1 family protein [Planctomycetota bacterium]
MSDDRVAQTRGTLKAAKQEHVLTYFDQLDAAGKAALLDQVEAQDWPALAELVETYVKQAPPLTLPTSIEPAPYYPAQPTKALADKYSQARAHGEKLIREGKVAAFTVAGGQGTRLGWDGPKGTYPATPVHKKSLFQVFAEYLIKVQRKYNTVVPWYIMTSPLNDAPTRAYFEEQNYFGLVRSDVTFFPQGTIPSFSLDGKALLAAKGELATNPDGHGGSLRALSRSGAIDDMLRRGVEQISYFQVDNPLVKCIDPLFIGLHALDGAQMSSKMVTKAAPAEKVGNFVLADGRISVIEYSDLPKELEQKVHADGSPVFNAGSIAIHVIAVAFVKQLNAGRFGLPYHRAVKKVPHVDVKTGQAVEPKEPNAVKLETFVFDALPLCEKSIVLEVVRAEEFGPIKNAEGADSAVTSRELQSQRAVRWLAAAGVDVAAGATVELSPLTAIEPSDLKSMSTVIKPIGAGERVAI